MKHLSWLSLTAMLAAMCCGTATLWIASPKLLAAIESNHFGSSSQQSGRPAPLSDVQALTKYRAELSAFRKEFGGTRQMPAVAFYQFGMGTRTKLLFKENTLRDALSGAMVRQWGAGQAMIVPPEYLVVFTAADGHQTRIQEDEQGVWIEENGRRECLAGSEVPLKLPRFEGCRYPAVLRVLHHEILINIIDGLPVPNFYVYRKPWYRDGAMMAMCLQKTDNLDLLRDWIMGLREPYDRNNAGETEADNLGQALYLISLVSNKNHPLVARVLAEAKKFELKDDRGTYIKGRSDFQEHPVYQTKWMKYGLRALELPDPYTVPIRPDSYSSLFWMDYRDRHVAGTEATDRGKYPYLGWATDHFLKQKLSPISNQDYPLTWEIEASQAAYAGMTIVHPVFTEEKTSVPHTWHASEIFLYLLNSERNPSSSSASH